jgi:nitrate/TMAO reductase-like tetraheme cytochrome c subunit
MKTRIEIAVILILMVTIFGYQASAQISPGDLSQVHSHLEGMSNCTQCHTLGDKVSDEKCLACHTEIKERVDLKKGYHASAGVTGKACVICHNDHHGRTFEIIRFEKEQFNHDLTGYKLLGAHGKKECKACHKSEFITDLKIKNKKYPSYLGLNTSCLSCHADYHENTLSRTCTDCHNYDAFKPASAFDHDRAKFRLEGKHKAVDCIKCHKTEMKNGKQVPKFAGIPFTNCTSCHTDVHKNQFGQNCRQCHSEESFHIISGMEDFDHNKTGFRLEDKHQAVSCKSCHKTALTDPVKHDRCADCHADYHNNQFAKQGVSPDCSSCHDAKGFSSFSFTIDRHNESVFPLQGAHLATPCFACHKKTEKWSFREIGIRCNDCHEDIHDPYLDTKYYPGSDCKICHTANTWSEINFDHAKTGFTLTGAHLAKTCRSCHFIKDDSGNVNQRFSGLTSSCVNCHKDVHARQFEIDGVSDCNRCHDSSNWKANKFDHDKTRFILDGRHKDVACNKCHKASQENEITYVQYKLNDFKCEDCHH